MQLMVLLAVTGGARANYVGETPVRVRIDGTDPRLLPDLTGRAEIVLQTESGMVVAPPAAVFQESGASFVYRKTGDRWEKRPVQPGLENHDAVAVRSGLRPGDVIALRRPL